MRSSHTIRAIPTESRIRTAATPLSHTGKTSAVQSEVRRQRTGPASTVADGAGLGASTIGTTRAAGVGSRAGTCGASCSASNATGTSRRGQPPRCQLGSNADARGSASTPPQASVHTRCRSDAAERRSNTVTPAASRSSTVDLTKASARMAIMSAALLPRVSDELAQTGQLSVGEACGREIEQRCDGLLRGTVEEGVQELSQRGLAGGAAGDRWEEYVAGTVLLMTQMPLFLEHSQQGADRGVTGRIGKLIEHLGGAGSAGPIDHVHDLPFPTAQLRVRFFGHCRSPNG